MRFVLFALFALATWNAQAQPVTASTDTLYLPPTLLPGDSPWESVTFTNQTDELIQVFGLGSNGPFGFDWECEGGDFVELQPGGTCVLYVRFEPRDGQPLGLTPGLVGFRLSTGTIQVALFGFSYTSEPIAGARNISTSLQPLGFDAPFVDQMTTLMESLEAILIDNRPQNDRSVCGRLGQFSRRVENEAANDDVRDWSAIAMVTQASAISSSLGCRLLL